MTTHQRPVSYGTNVVDDAELRLCGDLSGKRVVELGMAPDRPNAVSMATAGAKTIVLEPSADRVTAARREADDAGVHVEFHVGDQGDLGFATSASVDLVLSVHRLSDVDDLPRVLRQVHRVLKPEAPFVIAIDHPAASMPGEPYGRGTFTVSSLFMSLQRADFRVDVLHELAPSSDPSAHVPVTLIVRARKLGV